MNTIIELHDSRIAGVATRQTAIVVDFAPAYLHKSEGRPGVDAGTGWVQDVRLLVEEASVKGELPALPCEVTDGVLCVGAERHDNSIPVPLEATASIELRLVFDSGQSLTITGQGVRLELLGEPRYVEKFKS